MYKKVLGKKKHIVGSIFFLLIFGCVNSTFAQEADEWQYEFGIYGWLPDIEGQLQYGLPIGPDDGSISIDSSQILDSLDFTFMSAFEARRNRLSFFTDLIYLNVSNTKDTEIRLGSGPGPGLPVDASVGLDLKAWIVSGMVGYDLVQTEQVRFALIGGVRYLDLSGDTDLSINGPLPPTPPPANLSGSAGLWDGIVGIRGAIMANQSWYFPYYADIGAGDSEITWQLYAGVGYAFKWGDIKLGYRHLHYDQGKDKLIQDMKFKGPLLGVSFRF
ncbi:hypothetical protein ACFL3I_13230 [Pseudomonadota bacterium]